MKWSHLPVEGGLYNQDPALLEQFRYIFAKRAEHEERKRKTEERKRAASSGGGRAGAGRSRVAGRRR